MGQQVILVFHVFLALGIIGLVLLQRGKGADAGAGFGSGASGTVFGARGSSSAFSRATAILATLFFVTSLTLAYLSGRRAPTAEEESLLRGSAPAAQTQPAPASSVPAPQDVPAPQEVPVPAQSTEQSPEAPATPMQ